MFLTPEKNKAGLRCYHVVLIYEGLMLIALYGCHGIVQGERLQIILFQGNMTN